MDLWLRGDAANGGRSTAQALRSIAPNVDLPARSGGGVDQSPLRTVAVRSAQQGRDSWSVVVAAQFTVRDVRGGGGGAGVVVRYFAVPVVASGSALGAGAFTVTAAPAEVAGPGSAEVAVSRYQHRLAVEAPLVLSVGEFFNAYLTGVGEVGRYLAPGTTLSAVSGSGYRSVVVEQVAADRGTGGSLVPRDGVAVRVQARVTATDGAGDRWPLVYFLALTARSGRWEVTALEAGATSGAHSAPSASVRPSASAAVGGGAK